MSGHSAAQRSEPEVEIRVKGVEALKGARWIRARGISMFPALWPGDWLRVSPCPPNVARTRVSSGDVVVVVSLGGDLVAHRLLGIDPVADVWLLQGDRHLDPDGPVPEHAIAGQVVGVRRPFSGWACRVPDCLWRRRVSARVAGALWWLTCFTRGARARLARAVLRPVTGRGR